MSMLNFSPISTRRASGLSACLGLPLVLLLGCSSGLSAEDEGSTTFGSVSASMGSGSGESTGDGDPTGDGDGSPTGDGDGDPTGGEPFCGDQTCDPLEGEDCMTCPADCKDCPYCNDGMCNGNETCMNCAIDCEVCPGCGDAICDAQLGETCATCPQDCMDGCQGPVCGDDICNGDETPCTCADCGECVPMCGDGQCNGNETPCSCEQDCDGGCVGCGNGVCDPGENCVSCDQDCDCTCPCSGDPGFDNFCYHAPGTQGCPMTQPGGYCDPNGDGSYDDGDWNMGWFDYQAQCG